MIELIVEAGSVVTFVGMWHYDRKARKKNAIEPYDPNASTSCLVWEIRHAEGHLVDNGRLDVADMVVCENTECENCKPTRVAIAQREFAERVEAKRIEAEKQAELRAQQERDQELMDRVNASIARAKEVIAKADAQQAAIDRRRQIVEAERAAARQNECECSHYFSHGEYKYSIECDTCAERPDEHEYVSSNYVSTTPYVRRCEWCDVQNETIFVVTVGDSKLALCRLCYWDIREMNSPSSLKGIMGHNESRAVNSYHPERFFGVP